MLNNSTWVEWHKDVSCHGLVPVRVSSSYSAVLGQPCLHSYILLITLYFINVGMYNHGGCGVTIISERIDMVWQTRWWCWQHDCGEDQSDHVKLLHQADQLCTSTKYLPLHTRLSWKENSWSTAYSRHSRMWYCNSLCNLHRQFQHGYQHTGCQSVLNESSPCWKSFCQKQNYCLFLTSWLHYLCNEQLGVPLICNVVIFSVDWRWLHVQCCNQLALCCCCLYRLCVPP